jgi:hypothetical protein
MAVCDKTYQILTHSDSPYFQEIIPIAPYQDIPLAEATEFNCRSKAIRDPRESKGLDYTLTALSHGGDCCSPKDCC